MGEACLHVLENGFGVAVAAGPGTHEHGALNFTGMAQAQLLSDNRPHGNAHHLCGLDSQGIHKTRVVIGHHGARVVSLRLVRQTDTPIVHHNAAII